MWHTVRLTTFQVMETGIRSERFDLEAAEMGPLLLEVAEELLRRHEKSDHAPLGDLFGAIFVAMELVSTPSFSKAVTRDTEVARTLQMMKSSLARSLCFGASAPPGGTTGTSRDSSQN